MTTETKIQDQESPYYRLEQDGAATIVDPITGDALQPGTIPESLLADSELAEGFDFLARNGSRIHATLLLSRHGSPKDLELAGIDLRAEAEAVSQNKGVLLFEGVYSTENRTTTEQTFASVADLPDEDANMFRQQTAQNTDVPFAVHELAAIAGTHVHTALPDYVQGAERPVDRALTEWKQALDQMPAEAEAGDNKWLDAHFLTNAGFVMYRDMYLAGSWGKALADLDKQGLLPEVIDTRLVVGTHHAGIGSYIEHTGAEVTYRGEHNENVPESQRHIAKAAGASAISQTARIDQLAAMFEQIDE